MASVPFQYSEFVQVPPVIQITAGVVIFRNQSTCCPERFTSVRVLEKAVERGQRALERFAAGETDIIVDD